MKSVGYLIGLFWVTLAFGRLIFGKYVLPRVSDFLFLIISLAIIIAGFVIFTLFQNIYISILSIFILGLGCSSIYPTLITYGMKVSQNATSFTLSFLVTCGFVGGIFSLLCSAAIGRFLPGIVPIAAGPFLCFVIVILVYSAKKKKYYINKS